MNATNLKYIICPGSGITNSAHDIYESIYDCWSTVWSAAYKEMKFENKLYSDSFTRQTYIGAIFFEKKCLALCFFRWANANRSDFASDSYFSYWKPEDISKLSLQGPNVIISSHFTIHPIARSGNLDFSMKDLLTGISVEFFMNAHADAMAANLRRDKGINDSCANWGANLIRPNVPVSGGICGDLMVFYKDKVIQKLSEKPANKNIQQLWESKQIITKEHQNIQDYLIFKKTKTA